MKTIKYLFLAVALIMVAFFIGCLIGPWWHHPKHNPVGLTIDTNPGANTPNQIVQTVTGTGSGHINQTPWVIRPTPTPTLPPTDTDDRRVVNDHPPTWPSPSIEAWSADVPIKGEVTAKFTDKKTGKELGTETKPLTGTATVTGDASGLTVDTKFDSEFIFAVDVPERPTKRFHLGAMAGVKQDDRFGLIYGGYAQYDFLVKRWKLVDVKAPIRVEWTPGEWRGSIGLELNF